MIDLVYLGVTMTDTNHAADGSNHNLPFNFVTFVYMLYFQLVLCDLSETGFQSVYADATEVISVPTAGHLDRTIYALETPPVSTEIWNFGKKNFKKN